MDRARTLSPRCRFCSEYFGASQSPSPPDVAAGRAAQCEFCSVDRAQSSAREQVVADAPPQQLRRKRDRPSRIDVLIEQDASVDERKPKTSGPMDLDGAAERWVQNGMNVPVLVKRLLCKISSGVVGAGGGLLAGSQACDQSLRSGVARRGCERTAVSA